MCLVQQLCLSNGIESYTRAALAAPGGCTFCSRCSTTGNEMVGIHCPLTIGQAAGAGSQTVCARPVRGRVTPDLRHAALLSNNHLSGRRPQECSTQCRRTAAACRGWICARPLCPLTPARRLIVSVTRSSSELALMVAPACAQVCAA